jgi:methionyl-tRNA formyltransferase
VWTQREGKILKILSAQPIEGGKGAPGVILDVKSDYFEVGCGSGILRVTEVQPESRAAMKVADYVRGYHLKSGEILGG